MSAYAWEQLTPDQRALYECMSAISERCYFAGWMHGNEFRLWNAITDQADDLAYGIEDITLEECEELRRLHEACGGWIAWRNDAKNLPLDMWGPYFVPTEAWKHEVEEDNRQREYWNARLNTYAKGSA